MKKLYLAIVLVTIQCMSNGLSATAHEKSQRLIVGSGGAECPSATFSHVQDAISQAPQGAEVHVCPGIYNESIQITKPIHLTGDVGAILMPDHILPNAISLTSGSQFSAVVQATNAEDVTIEGLAIDGGSAAITQCSPDLIGILFQNASGSIKRNTIRNTKLRANLNGCQNGLGIFVQSGGGGISEVLIAENHVSDYQKNGITADELGTTANIRDNDLIGLGPTNGAAQNGIQIGYGAAGEISHNFVTGHIWSPCSSASQCQYSATGILVEQSDHIEIEGNSVGNNQTNIFINGRDARVRRNKIYGSIVLDGIQIHGDGARLEDNRIVNSAEAAISVFANYVSVRDNTLMHAPVGILESSLAIGLKYVDNRYIDVDKPFVDPDPPEFVSGSNDPVR